MYSRNRLTSGPSFFFRLIRSFRCCPINLQLTAGPLTCNAASADAILLSHDSVGCGRGLFHAPQSTCLTCTSSSGAFRPRLRGRREYRYGLREGPNLDECSARKYSETPWTCSLDTRLVGAFNVVYRKPTNSKGTRSACRRHSTVRLSQRHFCLLRIPGLV